WTGVSATKDRGRDPYDSTGAMAGGRRPTRAERNSRFGEDGCCHKTTPNSCRPEEPEREDEGAMGAEAYGRAGQEVSGPEEGDSLGSAPIAERALIFSYLACYVFQPKRNRALL